MTNRRGLRARHKAHKRRTRWRKIRFRGGYYPCGGPLTATEVVCRNEERLIHLIDAANNLLRPIVQSTWLALHGFTGIPTRYAPRRNVIGS